MTKTLPRIAIVGAGAWGTCLANLAARNGLPVQIWSRRGSESLATVLAEADILISAVAIAGVRGTIAQLQQLEIPPHLTIVTATKGLDPETTQTPYRLWKQGFPQQRSRSLSGQNLSKEINQGLPAATVIA
ncbi:MAG: glycerol-3-phosphate dehydrogenase, partial [Chloroflexaceae bacterium]|nr:glycerol-3-phosphate dehydrogenase [Chloroflexaceae bacterium]